MRRVARALDAAGVPYMLSGSVASSLQGEPRATHDVDLVVSLTREALPVLLGELDSPEVYVSEAAALDALGSGGMFNLIDTTSGDKVDFWMLTDEPFDVSRFARRRSADIMGIQVPVSAPEDTILMKLAWARRSGGSEKQLMDALGVFEVQRAELDIGYMREWAERLGVDEALTRIEAKAEAIE